MRPIDPRLVRHATAARTYLAIVVALGLGLAATVLAQAELLARAIAEVVHGDATRREIMPFLVALGAVIAARAVLSWAQERAAVRSSAVVKSQLRSRIVAHAARQGPGAPRTGRAEVATLAVRGLDALDAYFAQYLPQLVLAVIVPVVVLVRLSMLDLLATVTVAVTLPLIPVFMVLIGRTTEAANAKRWDALQRLAHHFLDVAAGMETLKVFGRGKAQADLVRASTDRYRSTTMSTLRVAFLSSLVLELLATLSVALVAVEMGLRLLDGDVGLRVALTVIVLAPEAYLPLRLVGTRYHAAAEGVAAVEQVFAVLGEPARGEAPAPAVPGAPARRVLTGAVTALEVDAVTVEHAGRAVRAPDSVSFVAPVGELVAVVGPSGSGKTTLLAVLLGLRPPDSGRVVVHTGEGREDLASLDPERWHRVLAWVDQTPYLFAGTVADNARLAAPAASDDEVQHALRAAGLGGIDVHRPVGERGRGLSAGERRRVALARAVLRDAAVVLLDEPTAGLDDATETSVLDTIRDLARTRMVVMATHRPAAIAAADRVVVLRALDRVAR